MNEQNELSIEEQFDIYMDSLRRGVMSRLGISKEDQEKILTYEDAEDIERAINFFKPSVIPESAIPSRVKQL